MSIVNSTAMIAGAVVSYRALFLGTRMARVPWWARDSWAGNVFVPCVLAMITLGVGLLMEALLGEGAQQLTAIHAGGLAAILVAAYGAWNLLTRWARARAAEAVSDASRTVSAVPTAVGGDIANGRGKAIRAGEPSPPKAA